MKAQVEKTFRLTVHEARDAKPLRKATKFTECGPPFLKVHEVRDNPALGKEPERLSSIGALLRPENLYLSRLGCRVWHVLSDIGESRSR